MRRTTLALLPLLLAACGGSDSASDTPWEAETVTYRAPDGTETEVAIGDGCGDLGDKACSDIQDECGDRGAADVFVDEDGEVLEVICFPAAGETDAVIVLSGEGAPPTVDNKDVIVLEGDEDTPAVVGDLELDSNNVTLYGDDPATSILDGNLDISKNNALVSGVTITGDVHITFNNAVLSNCVIEGNLTLEGNNAKIAGCRIEEDVNIIGNNNELTSSEILGEFTDDGQNTCIATEVNKEGESTALECD